MWGCCPVDERLHLLASCDVAATASEGFAAALCGHWIALEHLALPGRAGTPCSGCVAVVSRGAGGGQQVSTDSASAGQRGQVVAHGRSTADGAPVTLLAIHGGGGVWIFQGPEGAVGVRLPGKEVVGLCRRVLDRCMTARPCDPWRDVEGAPIVVGCWVEQITVNKAQGASPSRLHRKARVVGFGNSRVLLLFDGAKQTVRVWPHLLRVITPQTAGTDE